MKLFSLSDSDALKNIYWKICSNKNTHYVQSSSKVYTSLIWNHFTANPIWAQLSVSTPAGKLLNCPKKGPTGAVLFSYKSTELM